MPEVRNLTPDEPLWRLKHLGKRDRKYFFLVAHHFFSGKSIVSSETDAVIKKSSALAFSRRKGLRTQAIVTSYKISQMNSKDFCFCFYEQY